jgi:hypothetical protein
MLREAREGEEQHRPQWCAAAQPRDGYCKSISEATMTHNPNDNTSAGDPLERAREHTLNRVINGVLERARRKLQDKGIDPSDAFPARLVRDLLPSRDGRRMCLEAVYRAIGRGQLDAVRVGRMWYCDLESFVRWIERKTSERHAHLVDNPPSADAEDLHGAVAKRLRRPGTREGK